MRDLPPIVENANYMFQLFYKSYIMISMKNCFGFQNIDLFISSRYRCLKMLSLCSTKLEVPVAHTMFYECDVTFRTPAPLVRRLVVSNYLSPRFA